MRDGRDGGTTPARVRIYASTSSLRRWNHHDYHRHGSHRHRPNAGFGTPDPVYNALVYVPNSRSRRLLLAYRAISARQPRVSAGESYHRFDGKFTLTNVPAGVPINIVVQLGRWRRSVAIPAVPACGPPRSHSATSVSAQPYGGRHSTDGDSNCSADPIECVLRKMGIENSELHCLRYRTGPHV